jgi:hypothetical protein
MRSVGFGPVGLIAPMVLVAATTFLLIAGCGLTPAVLPEQALRGDVNGDGVIDQADLDLASAAFGRSQEDPLFVPAADLNEDGVVGLDDLRTLVDILNAQGNAAGG